MNNLSQVRSSESGLPEDFPRCPVSSFLRATESRIIEKADCLAIQQFCDRESVDKFCFFLSAIQVFVSQFTGDDDVVIGSLCERSGHNRQPKKASTKYFFPVKTNLSGNPIGQEILRRTIRSVMETRDFVDGADGVAPDVTTFPFKHIVYSENIENPLLSNPMSQEDVFLVEEYLVQCDVNYKILGQGATFCLLLEYDRELFEVQTIRRWIEYILQIVILMVSNLQLPLSQFCLVTPEEEHQLLVSWNDTKKLSSPILCLHQLIEKQTEQTPDAIAVRDQGQSLTYRALNRQANRVGHYLRSLGVKAEFLVGIFLEPSVDLLICLLGIFKAGGAYLPLDPDHPSERLRFIIQDSRVKLLLTQQALLQKLPQTDSTVVCLDMVESMITEHGSHNIAIELSKGNLAYVIYTSGSTGKPKAVSICHQNLMGVLRALHHESGLTEHDVLVAITTLTFDIAAMELFLPLIMGGQVVLASREMSSDGKRLLQLLNQSEATALQATPSTWLILIEAGLSTHPAIKKFCGGEVLPASFVPALLKNGQELWNLYGPTETTIWATSSRISSNRKTVSIGRPLPNTSIYLLGPHLAPVPIGVVGDLYISGVGVARGYLNNPDKTAENFVPHPFSQLPGERIYQTGDRARYRYDGTLDFMGRRDAQVKIRGFRIELGEIESVLHEHSRVCRAVARAQEIRVNDVRLIAYVVLETGQQLTGFDLRQFLMKKIPAYMVPSHFVFLETLPLTQNGKIDRQALPPCDSSQFFVEETSLAPEGAIEEVLASIWREVFRVGHIGKHDNFFELGGHSLLMTQVVARIRKNFDVELGLREFFQCPTVAGQAHAIKRLLNESGNGHDEESNKDLMHLLDQIDHLSEDELRTLLESQMDSNSSGT